jgi:DNA-binding phage protein
MIKVRDYKEHLLEHLQDLDEAAAYFNAALHDKDPMSLALRDIAEAQSGMSWLADVADSS